MANIYKGTLGLIGNTPLVEVVNVEKELGLEAKILVKLEYFNPAGSSATMVFPLFSGLFASWIAA